MLFFVAPISPGTHYPTKAERISASPPCLFGAAQTV